MSLKLFVGEQEFLTKQELGFNNPIITDFVKYEPPERKYSLRKIIIGVDKYTNKEVSLDFSKSKRVLILGKTGAGKTVITNRLLDYSYLAGSNVFIIDYKGEYTRKNEPLQKHFHKFLLSGEKPKGFPLKIYYPAFLHTITHKELMPNESLIQYSLTGLNKEDLVTLFSRISNSQMNFGLYIELLWETMEKEGFNDIEEINYLIDNTEEINPLVRPLLKKHLRILINNKVLGEEYEQPDFIKDLNDNKMTILNLKGMSNYSERGDNPALVYVAIALRKLYFAKQMNYLSKKPLIISLDELHKFCPRIASPSSKKAFLKLLDLSRSERISLISSSQDWKRIPDTVLKQANYIFLSHTIGLDDMYELFKLLLPNEYDNPISLKNKISEIMREMKVYPDKSRDWLLINTDLKKWGIIIPKMPLSHLTEEGE